FEAEVVSTAVMPVMDWLGGGVGVCNVRTRSAHSLGSSCPLPLASTSWTLCNERGGAAEKAWYAMTIPPPELRSKPGASGSSAVDFSRELIVSGRREGR